MATRTADKVEVLSQLRLFEHCTKRDLSALARASVEETFPPGAVLTREGQAGDLAFVILTGSAVVRRHGRRVGTLGPGEVVGELSVLDGGSRTATVTAEGEVSALALAGDDFRSVVQSSPRFTGAVLRTLAERIRRADRQLDLRG